MTITIKDVAREANVSIATVSRVINGKDKVKKETREKIQRAVEKLNFTPDQAARTMINKKTKTVGMIIPLLSNEYWANLAELIQGELLKKGYTLIIGTSFSGQHAIGQMLGTFLERRVDGLIVGGFFHLREEHHLLKQFTDQGIPLVSFDSFLPGVTAVCGDHLKGAMDAVEHLIGLGHTKIAYIGAESNGIDRELGCRNALMLSRIAVDESIILGGRGSLIHHFSQYGYQCAKQLLESKKDFTALFCGNDLIAIGAIKAMEEFGLEVPRHVAVVGFDDISMASLYRPTLTTVKQPVDEMVDAAVQMLLEQIEGPEKNFSTRKVTFPMQVIVRQSCGSKIPS